METTKNSKNMELQEKALLAMYYAGEVEPKTVKIRDFYTGRTYTKLILHSVECNE